MSKLFGANEYKVGDAFIDITGIYGTKYGLGIIIGINERIQEPFNTAMLSGELYSAYFFQTLDSLVNSKRFLWLPANDRI